CSGEFGALAKPTVADWTPTWKYTTFDEPPPGPGLTMVTETVCAVATPVAGTTALKCSLSTNVVVSGVPLKSPVAPETKPVPLTRSVSPGPPGATAAGTSGWFKKGTALDVS